MNGDDELRNGGRTRRKKEKQNNTQWTLNEQEMYGCEGLCCSATTNRHPISCMQSINNAKGALSLLCLALLMEGIINAGLFNALISTIEKRFQFRSTESGIIASSFDIFTCIALVVVAFSGDRAHKPLWFGWGTFIMGAGCILFSMPHFFAPSYSYKEENSSYCGSNATEIKCHESGVRNYIYVFIVANGMIGLGSTPLFTMAITYLDENVKQTNSALYGGIYYSMGALGPAIGYLLGSALVNVYTNIGEAVDIHPTSSLWIGAWWIGFLVAGTVSIFLSIFICMFPRKLPGTTRFRQNRNTELHRHRKSIKAINDQNFGKSWKDAPKVIILLLWNLPYISLTLSSCINFAFVYGFNTFGAKYIESIFGVQASSAALYFGVAAIFAAAGGQFMGGYLVTKHKLTVKGIINMMIICTIFGVVTTFGFLMSCDNQKFAGATVPYHGETENELSAPCNAVCECTTDIFEPVCGSDGITYFSPCFAGCEKRMNETVFSYCACVMNAYNGSSAQTTSSVRSAKLERCSGDSCGLIWPFILVIFLAFFATLMKTTPNLQATLRCIPFNLRTPGLSLQRLIFTLLGTIPGRIISGKVMDLACVSWSTECGELGACKAYNRADGSKYMFILLCSEMVLCVVLQVWTAWIYKPTKDQIGTTQDDNRGNVVNVGFSNQNYVSDDEIRASGQGVAEEGQGNGHPQLHKTIPIPEVK